MSVTTEQLTKQTPNFVPYPEAQPTADEVERQVLSKLDDVLDTTSEKHQLFYGDPGVLGVNATRLKDVEPPHSGCRVLLQDETEHTYAVDGELRTVPAFKRRGAWLAVISDKLENPELQETTAASSGNHAKALVAASQQLGMTATIFMAETSDPGKQQSLRELGANLDTSSKNLAEAMHRSKTHAEESAGTTFVHPYDHYRVIAGQATAAAETLDSLLHRSEAGELDLHKDRILVAVPLGGGGYAAATGIVFKRARDQHLIGDNVRVVAVQPENKPTNQFCDGTMAHTGEKAQAVLADKRYVQGVITVKDQEIAEAMAWLYQTTGKRVEPAGALATTLATTQIARDGDVLVAMMSGASVSDTKFNDCMSLAEANGYDTSFLSGTAVVGLAARVRSGTRVWNGR